MSEPQPPPMTAQEMPDTPLPRPARMGVRMLAFLMDFLLIFFLNLFLLTKVLLPMYHNEGMQQFATAFDGYVTEVQQAQENGQPSPPMPAFEKNEAIVNMLTYTWGITMLMYWLYFGLLEGLLKGASLGKRTFGLRTVRLDTGLPALMPTCLFRGGLKAIFLTFPVPTPILWWANYLVPFFNRNRRAGHDFISRTIVISG